MHRRFFFRHGRTKVRKGFTLIELLIAIAIIGTLASIVVIAVNPTRQLASARDAKRNSDAVNLEKALYQYMIDKGSMPVTMPTDATAAKAVCREGTTDPSCLDFDLLTPDYLAAIPLDATETNSLFTGYKAYQQVGRPRVVSTYLGTDGGATTGGGAGPLIGTAGNPGASCLAILSGGGSTGNGSYWIDPDGSGGSAAFQAYCDMTTDGGGWTIIASYTGADGEQALTSDTEVLTGNPLAFAHYNISRAKKIALSGIASGTLVKRNSGQWIKANAAAFDANLNAANSHSHVSVTVTASNGTAAAGVMGYSNFGAQAGGDFGITSAGFDHHNPVSYNHLNGGCANHYLYSYSAGASDNDAGYDVNISLGDWAVTSACDGAEGGSLVFFVAMR